MKTLSTLILTGAVASTLTLSAGIAHAGDCRSDFQIAGDLWQKYGDEIKKIAAELGASLSNLSTDEIRAKLDNAEQQIARAQAKANETLKNSKFKIGPRGIKTGETLHGDLMTERVFLTPGPVVDNTVKVTIDGEGGGAKSDVNVTICLTDSSGATTKVHDFSFGARDYNSVFQRTINDAKDKVISIHFDRKKWGLNVYKYAVKLSR